MKTRDDGNKRRARRGVTLIEILVVIALLAIFGGVLMTVFSTSSARLRRGATIVAGSVRTAYTHATASAKVVRLVFDIGTQTISLEETRDRHLLKHDTFGGDAADDAQAEAYGAADASSVRSPPSAFTQLNLREMSGMRSGKKEELADEDEPVQLPEDIQFWAIDVEHQALPITEGKAYLYFFPGGQTENASIQLRVSNAGDDQRSGYMTVLVSPLTGKASIQLGRVDAPKPRDDIEASELQDPGK